MTVPPLPVEIYSQILDHVGHTDLYALLFVCRVLHREAEKRLYRKFTIDELNAHRVFTTMTRLIPNGGRVGRYIHFLDMYHVNPSSDLIKALAESYVFLPNLLFLSLPYASDPLVIPPPSAPFSLTTFHVRPMEGDAILSAVKVFLESQHSIVDFLITKPTPLSLLPTALPNLRILQAYPESLKHIISGRTVTHLSIYGDELRFGAEKLDMPSLKSLRITYPDTLSHFQDNHPNLELLQMYFVRTYLLASDPTLLTCAQFDSEPLRKYLPSMPKLLFLDCITEMTAEQLLEMFKISPRLRHIDCRAEKPLWRTGIRVSRWILEDGQLVLTESDWSDNTWKEV